MDHRRTITADSRAHEAECISHTHVVCAGGQADPGAADTVVARIRLAESSFIKEAMDHISTFGLAMGGVAIDD